MNLAVCNRMKRTETDITMTENHGVGSSILPLGTSF
jgi:hypothetical protein